MRWSVLLALGVPLLQACDDDTFAVIPEPEFLVDEFEQVAASEVDILWVVDNSQSMARVQDLLAANIDRFIEGFTTCGSPSDLCDLETQRCSESGAPCQAPDFHLGVISTDPRDEGRLRAVGVCAPGPNAAPANGRFRYCSGRPLDCTFDPDDPTADPENSICSFADPLRFVSTMTPNPTGAFGQMVRFQLQGGQAAREEGITSATLALGSGPIRQDDGTLFTPSPPPENAGFLREDAALFVIFVSDEEDSSFGFVSHHYRAFETFKLPGNEAKVSLSAIVGDPDPDGVEGREEGGCEIDGENAGQAGPRYVALAMYSRGREADLRVCDGERLLCGGSQTCSAPIPDVPGVCLPRECSRDDQCGGDLCNGEPCARCGDDGTCSVQADAILALLGQNGIFQSICSDDYGPVLDALGFGAAGLSRKFSLSQNPDCRETVPCCGDSEPDCDLEAPLCVTVDGEVVPNDRETGWIYDLGSNSVFFDGDEVPGPGARVVLRYRLFPALGAPGCGPLVSP